MSSNRIQVETNPPEARLRELGVFGWPTWSKEVSVFPWTYDEAETFYLLEGEVIVTPDGGRPVRITQGDLVTCPSGMSCTWDVRQPIRKHYNFS